MLWNWNTIDACKLTSYLTTKYVQCANKVKKGFLSKSWHITSRGMFAGSCIGVICLVLCLEFLRRVGREYDAFIIRRAKLRHQYLSSEHSSASASLLQTPQNERNGNGTGSDSDQQQQQQQDENKATTTTAAAATTTTRTRPTPFDGDQLIIRPTLVEQFVRATLHLFQFAVAYFIMLLAMYFNGYIIICIFIGAFLGAFIFSWEGLVVNAKEYVVFPLSPIYCCILHYLLDGVLMLTNE